MRKISKNVYAFISKQFIRQKADELFCLKGRNKINGKRSSKKHDLSGCRMSKLQLLRMEGLAVYPTVIRIV